MINLTNNTSSSDIVIPFTAEFPTPSAFIGARTSHDSFNNNSRSTSDMEALWMNFFKQALIESFNKSINKNKFVILISTLFVLAIIGSFSNLMVLIVLALRDDCMELDIKNNVGRSKNVEETITEETKFMCKNKNDKNGLVKYKKSAVKLKINKKSNSIISPKPIYLLIQYLAVVDFITCSVAMPGTIIEMLNINKSNEVFCKIFEQIRATGVLLSNFLVLIISFERFMLLCKPFNNLKIIHFKILLIIITIFSLLMGGLSAYQVSVYQKFEGKVVFIGICLANDVGWSTKSVKILKLFITSFLLIGASVIGFLYIFIFRQAFIINKKRVHRQRIKKKLLDLNTSNTNNQSTPKKNHSHWTQSR